MATLTANVARLPEHCDHKLPTSCQLTARPVCCACQDNRPHASSYSKYIDGVGFVPWGTRQERYCWPCREFWTARISVSGMRPSDTRLPESPDLTNFLEQWFDWHRGYRATKADDGTEQRHYLVGEPLSECAHGFLPRSVEELRNGMQPGDRERIERGGQPERPTAPVRRQIEDDFVVPEDERLFDEEPEESVEATAQSTGQPTVRQLAAAEHGHLAELAGDNAFESHPSSSTAPDSRLEDARADVDLTQPLRIARDHYQRVTNLRRELGRMRVGIERVMSGLQGLEVDIPDTSEAVEQLNRLNGSLGRYREAPLDLPELNNPDYQSPITGMFERAWRWHQQVQSDRMHALSAQDTPAARDAQGRMMPPTNQRTGNELPYNEMLAEWRATRMQRLEALPPPRGIVRAEEPEAAPFMGLDEPGRPPAIEDDEAFKVEMRCEVCLQQVANVATFPCGHMVMCQWCADEVVPRHISARNVPRDPGSKCPQCRRKVRHIYTVHVRLAKNYAEEKEEGKAQKGSAVEAAS